MTVWCKRKDALVLCSEKGPLLRHFEGLCGDLIGQQRMKGIQTVDLVQVRASTDRTGGAIQDISHHRGLVLLRADGNGYAFHPKPIQEDANRTA